MSGNLFREIPPGVDWSGCDHLDCLKGCDIRKGHCRRLAIAIEVAKAVEIAKRRGTVVHPRVAKIKGFFSQLTPEQQAAALENGED